MSAAPEDVTLYRKPDLAAAPQKPFVILGSEASADKAAKLLSPDYVATTWPERAGAWQWVDLRPLMGRKGLLVPDGTDDSRHDMVLLGARLAEIGCSLRITDTTDRPEDWTLADWEGTRDEFIAWARAHTSQYVAPQRGNGEMPADLEPAPPQEAYSEADPPPVALLQAGKPRRRKPELQVVGNAAPLRDPDALPQPAALSHDALAEAFVEAHGEDWRYVAQWGKWYEWAADGWREERTEKQVGLAKAVTREALEWPEAQNLTASGRREVNSISTAKALLSFARSHRSMAATVDQWDIDPMLLGVPGGVIDLRDAQMLEARHEQYITKRTACAPLSGSAPLWMEFLNTVTAENGDLISFLQRFSGYCLTGETREQCLAFLYGTGQNGKGVFIQTLRGIMGDYTCSASADVFMESEHARHPTEIARLRGARLVTVDETDNSKRWNERLVKRITGGGKMEAHFMRQDDFEFTPQFKLLIAGNHKPQLRGVGKAIQRRIHLVPFTVTIPDEARDDKLVEKLQVEYPQILSWAIEGCSIWQARGLMVPPDVVSATQRYIEAEDTIGEWLEECTEQSGSVERPVAYKNYQQWAENRGERGWSTKAFWAALEERGYNLRKTSSARYIVGLSLKLGATLAPSLNHLSPN